MGMTIIEKVLARASGTAGIAPGDGSPEWSLR